MGRIRPIGASRWWFLACRFSAKGLAIPVTRPSKDQLADLNERLGLGLSGHEIEEFHALVDGALQAHDWVESETRTVAQPPRRNWAPAADENPFGGWYWRSEISTVPSGLLAGKTVAVKDNVCVAGVPMMNGSAVLEGYVPETDATAVARLLGEGAIIAGKAVCESLCFSGGSHTSDTGPVRNPYDPTRSSGGSSSGCGALLASGAVDLALGGDQGGSIRAPSAWSGVYGLKPTYGLVPYTGAFPLEMTLDHLGPMARSSEDVALMLDVIAGPDGLDPRQPSVSSATGRKQPYSASLDNRLDGTRVAILAEGFEWEGVSEPDVDQSVRDAARALGELGASVADVSIPIHRFARNVSFGIAAEGVTALLIHTASSGNNWKGHYSTDMIEAYARGLAERRTLLPPMLKMQTLVGQWLHEQYSGVYYAKAQNLSRKLIAEYDKELARNDLLVMPTLPAKAQILPDPGSSATESVGASHLMGANTAPFNVTGHPAMSVPCAINDGLPVGMMIVGRRGEDERVLRVAHAFEQGVFRPPPPIVVRDGSPTSGGPRAA